MFNTRSTFAKVIKKIIPPGLRQLVDHDSFFFKSEGTTKKLDISDIIQRFLFCQPKLNIDIIPIYVCMHLGRLLT